MADVEVSEKKSRSKIALKFLQKMDDLEKAEQKVSSLKKEIEKMKAGHAWIGTLVGLVKDKKPNSKGSSERKREQKVSELFLISTERLRETVAKSDLF